MKATVSHFVPLCTTGSRADATVSQLQCWCGIKLESENGLDIPETTRLRRSCLGCPCSPEHMGQMLRSKTAVMQKEKEEVFAEVAQRSPFNFV